MKKLKTILFAIASMLCMASASHAMVEHKLYGAVGSEDMSRVIKLLNDNAKPDGEDSDYIPLCMAARNESDDSVFVEVLLKAGADIEKKSEGGATALYMSILYSKETITRFLLAHEANPNILVAPAHRTLLHIITLTGDDTRRLIGIPKVPATFAQLLLDHGAKTNIKDDNDMTALDLAKKHNRLDIVEVIETHEKKLGTKMLQFKPGFVKNHDTNFTWK